MTMAAGPVNSSRWRGGGRTVPGHRRDSRSGPWAHPRAGRHSRPPVRVLRLRSAIRRGGRMSIARRGPLRGGRPAEPEGGGEGARADPQAGVGRVVDAPVATLTRVVGEANGEAATSPVPPCGVEERLDLRQPRGRRGGGGVNVHRCGGPGGLAHGLRRRHGRGGRRGVSGRRRDRRRSGRRLRGRGGRRLRVRRRSHVRGGRRRSQLRGHGRGRSGRGGNIGPGGPVGRRRPRRSAGPGPAPQWRPTRPARRRR